MLKFHIVLAVFFALSFVMAREVFPQPPMIMSQEKTIATPPQPHEPTNMPVSNMQPVVFSNKPTSITCSTCKKEVTTTVTYTTVWHTHLVAGSVCMVTMICSLCCLGLVPYCFDSFKDAEHYCPDCKTFVGKHTKY